MGEALTYNREAAKAPAHYDHRGLWCLRCQTQQSHYRAHKSTAPWRCTVCEHVDGEPAPDPADALYNRATGWNAMKSEDVDNPRTAERLAEVAASVAKEFPERLVGGNGRTPQPMPAMDPIQKALAAAQPTDPYVPRMDRRWQEKYGVIQSVPATPAGIAQAAQGVCTMCPTTTGDHHRCAACPRRGEMGTAADVQRERERTELERDLYDERKRAQAVEAECERLRAQLAQRPDARLREAATAIVEREANRQWNDDRGAYIKIARSEWAALRSALAADPAPQVEREALPTLAELQESDAERRVYEHAYATHSERFRLGPAAGGHDDDYIARQCAARGEDAVRRWRLTVGA